MADLEAIGLQANRGRRSVLSDVDLRACPGEVLAVLGPNGAGKTTLIKALAGLIPHEGQVRIGSRSLSEMSPVERAKAVAYVPQRSMLRSALRVQEVVAQGRYAHQGTGEHVRSSLEAVGASHLAERPFTQLSVGEQQRVLLARALATEAPHLLLDEPTSALDVGQALSTFALLRSLASEGRSIVVVLHGLNDARRHADRCVLLHGGTIHAEGSPEAVVSEEVIAQTYGVKLIEGGALSFEVLR